MSGPRQDFIRERIGEMALAEVSAKRLNLHEAAIACIGAGACFIAALPEQERNAFLAQILDYLPHATEKRAKELRT